MRSLLRVIIPNLLVVGAIVTIGSLASAQVLHEDFDENIIDPSLWEVTVLGTGPSMVAANQQLEVAMPGDSEGYDLAVRLASTFLMHGDFDVQVSFRLFTWPFANGVRMGLGTNHEPMFTNPGVERISFGQNDYPGAPREAYLTDFPDQVHGITATDDMVGTLRLVRSGATQTGYYLDGSTWVPIHTGPAPTQDIGIKIATWSSYQFMGWDVTAAWDDLVINSGEIVGSVATQKDTWGAVKSLFR